MSDKGSVFQKGGGGTNFEQAVQTAFLTTLIIRGNAPLNHANEIIEVAFQTTNRNCETDDLLIVAKSSIGQHRLLVQIKHNITFTADNNTFKEVITAFWKDYNNPVFDRQKDKLVIVKSGFTKEERNHLKSLLNWAKTHASETDFVLEVNRIKGKKDRLDVFRESLKEVNNNITLTDKEIWEFLKCFDILEYDFTNQNSVDEIYFLNLIKLCKNKETTSNEKEIWDVILSFVSKRNKDGGSATIDSIQNEELYKHFDTKKLNPYFKAVDKLRSDGEVVLSPLKNTIGGFHLERKNINQLIVDSVNNCQFTIVTGKPGVGKSASIKDVLKTEFSSASIFVFRADQFNEPHIANVFSSQGVNETIHDIFSCISLIPDKIIFIDSIEKLLEADPECAFKQLLALFKKFPDIKVICSSRKYAVDLITLKFGIDKKELGNVEVLPLEDNELNVISGKFPQLQNVLKNRKIKKLLQSPKYLDFAILALNKSKEDYTDISLTEFKNKLWNSLVVDSTNTKDGFPIKRENAFMEIAVNRAKEMKLFTKPISADAAAIGLLENDEILFQDNHNRKYSPTHDILEDWALVKYVSSKYEDNPNPKALFGSLGNEPAIRRAFRLWIEDYLIDDSDKINELIRASTTDISIEKYWADEILVAVFKSDSCALFFPAFEKELLANSAVLLNRCLHLIKTACKESDLSNNSMLLPFGSGWTEAILFIKKHILQLNSLRLTICNFLFDWEYRLLFQGSVDERENLAVKEITIHFLQQIELDEKFWHQELVKEKSYELITLLYNLTDIAKDEIISLIARAFNNKEDKGSWKLTSFYESVINKCISGISNHKLVKELPELVIQTAWKEWRLKIPEKTIDPDDRFGILRSNSIRDEDCWGIRDKHSFFPSGIYKTPVYNLLRYHPILGINFIVEFINYSIEFYIKAECKYKYDTSPIEIELNDGAIIKQLGAWELWAAYRGASVTHYALESILMSLEKYLLETAALKTTVSKSNLKFMFNDLLKNSNNVAITGVLASIAIAYPEEVEEEMLPLLTVQKFYIWDSSRVIKDSNSLAAPDHKISFAQKERLRLDQLPHRKQYRRGLADFIIDYQINKRKMNSQIHLVFDKVHQKVEKEDVVWKKMLTEIDIRKWEVKKVDENVGSFVIQPKYEEDVNQFVNSNKDYIDKQTKSLNYSGLLRNAYVGKENIEFQTWKECLNHYSKNEMDLMFDHPVTLAVLGLRDFSNELKPKEKKWCLETLSGSIVFILQDSFGHNYGLGQNFNLMEKETALSSFHYLFSNINKAKEKDALIYLMLQTLFAQQDIDKIVEYIRTIFFKHHPVEAKRVWVGLIKCAQFRKANPRIHHQDPNKLKASKNKEEKFVEAVSSSNDVSLNLSEVNFDSCDGYLLALAFIITPYNLPDDDFSKFIKHLIPNIIEELNKDEDYSYNRGSRYRNINHESLSGIERYIANYLLNASQPLSETILNLLLTPVLNSSLKTNGGRNDLYEFIGTTLDYVVLKLHDNGNIIPEPADYKDQLNNFWKIWEIFNDLVINSSEKPFIDKLLLNVRYLLFDFEGHPNLVNWKGLENKREFYKTMVTNLGEGNAKSILNVFSTIGALEFLPIGICWLVEIYKKSSLEIYSLATPAAERMVKNLFYNHISTIKKEKYLIDDFVWLLDKMVDLGSSEAYLFRENVITYKTIN